MMDTATGLGGLKGKGLHVHNDLGAGLARGDFMTNLDKEHDVLPVDALDVECLQVVWLVVVMLVLVHLVGEIPQLLLGEKRHARIVFGADQFSNFGRSILHFGLLGLVLAIMTEMIVVGG
jgi:hypothetical protein